MRTDARIPAAAWVYTIAGLWCFGVVVAHIAAIAAGTPLGSLWWALPLNLIVVLIDIRAVRGEVRRAIEKERAMRRT